MTEAVVHLMRHGAPQRPGLLLGHLDVPPHADGVARCVERARHFDFAQVVTSGLARAREPGALIAAERGVEHCVDARWRELCFGAWEGADPATLQREALARFWDDPERFPPPQGECWTALCARVEEALHDLVGTVLVVSHAGAMRAALSVLCGLDARQCWAVDLPYGAVMTLRLWPGRRPSGQMMALMP